MIDINDNDIQSRSVEIWCLDLLFTNKWFKSNKYLNLYPVPDRILLTKYDYIYAMMAHQKSSKYMVKFHVSQIIPHQLAKRYIAHYSKSVHGYIRLKIEKMYNMTVPTDLKRTVSPYFSPL